MRKMIACWTLALCLCFVFGSTTAEVQLLPQIGQWDAELPLEIVLSADVKSHMPFDDDRCAQLNSLLKHVSLRIGSATGEDEILYRMAVQVDATDALWLMQKESQEAVQLQLSTQPDVAFAGGANTLDILLGQEPSEITLYGFDGTEINWLDDGAELIERMGAALEDYRKQTAIKTNIKNMGLARTKITYTIPKADVSVLAQAIADYCPEGELRCFLTALQFSGQQKLILWLGDNGEVFRAEYAGNCGVDDMNLRKVSLVWRMLRDEDVVRDDLRLKTPAVQGSDYNTLNCTRDLEKKANGNVTCEIEFDYGVKANKQRTTYAGEIQLTSLPEDDDNRLTGSMKISQTLPDADYATSIVLAPDLLVGQDAGAPVISGKVNVQELRGKAVLEDADVYVEAGPGEQLQWNDSDHVEDISAMTDDQKASVTESFASALIPHLVLLPQEDTLYLSADLPDDVWQRIVDAAQNALAEEEAP